MITSAHTTAPARTTLRNGDALHELLQRIEGEYREMPGLCVNARQAERLWGLDSATCSFVLMSLVESGVIKRTHGGNYIRR